MDRGTPQRIGVRALPRNRSPEDRGNEPADAGFVPCANIEFVHGSYRVGTVFEQHSRDGNTLVVQGTAIVVEEKVEIPPVLVQNHRKVAVSAGEKSISRAAIQGIPVERTMPRSRKVLPPSSETNAPIFGAVNLPLGQTPPGS